MRKCQCFQQANAKKKNWNYPVHEDSQNLHCEAWFKLLEAIDQAAKDKRELFAPGKDLGSEYWNKIVTLPKEISQLKHVKHLMLYGSHLEWIPPEIGEMESLETFTPYTSYALHWFPYEITKCIKLNDSTVSTRTLYGNYKHRWPFPPLKGNPVSLYIERAVCGVCGNKLGSEKLEQYWISLRVATDVLPLLIHVCSDNCLNSLPKPQENYVSGPHKGGKNLQQPEPEW